MHPGNETSSATPPGAQSMGELLQASRRLDWRFLLEEPELGRVLYAGPPQGRLWESLRLCSGSLSVVGATDRMAGEAEYDVAVTRNPERRTLRLLASLLRPGGWLYAEIDAAWKRRWSPRRASPRFPHDYRRLLERLGMAEIEMYWHWPDFEACTMIVPLDDPAALLYLLKRARRGRKRPFPPAVGRWLLRIGLLALVVPSFSAVSRRRDHAGGPEAHRPDPRRPGEESPAGDPPSHDRGGAA